MTGYEQGEVVLVRFVSSDETGAKRRPAVVVSTGDYQRGREEAIVAAITSNTDRLLVGDHLIAGWQEAGLLFPSVATGVIRTVKQTMIERRLGLLTTGELEAIQEKLRQVLGL
jgi:mRNA-degrading endonuclease toxin of MazEF toxin-antitoxin module